MLPHALAYTRKAFRALWHQSKERTFLRRLHGTLSPQMNTKTTGGVILSHSGRQHAYRTALALQTIGALNLFLTSSYYKRDRFPDRFARLVPRIDNWLERRYQSGLDSAQVIRFPMLELPEVAYRFLNGNDRYAAELVRSRDMRFDRLVSKLIPSLHASVFWGFQGSCASSLRAAHNSGMTTVMEYASIPDRIAQTLLAQDSFLLQDQIPSKSVQPSKLDPANVGGAPDIYLAASSFSASCLESSGVLKKAIRVIPLGVDLARFPYRRRDLTGPLKVLFVGKLARHKGLHYLLEAVRMMDSENIQVSIVGPSVGDDSSITPFASLFTALGPLEGDALVRAFHNHDVLVVPSLYEGFGFVILEAMASGMPVIATENSCAPDVIREGVDGFVVPVRDAEAIASHLDWCARNRMQLLEKGCNATSRAREYSWGCYEDRVSGFIAEVLAQAHAKN